MTELFPGIWNGSKLKLNQVMIQLNSETYKIKHIANQILNDNAETSCQKLQELQPDIIYRGPSNQGAFDSVFTDGQSFFFIENRFSDLEDTGEETTTTTKRTKTDLTLEEIKHKKQLLDRYMANLAANNKNFKTNNYYLIVIARRNYKIPNSDSDLYEELPDGVIVIDYSRLENYFGKTMFQRPLFLMNRI